MLFGPFRCQRAAILDGGRLVVRLIARALAELKDQVLALGFLAISECAADARLPSANVLGAKDCCARVEGARERLGILGCSDGAVDNVQRRRDGLEPGAMQVLGSLFVLDRLHASSIGRRHALVECEVALDGLDLPARELGRALSVLLPELGRIEKIAWNESQRVLACIGRTAKHPRLGRRLDERNQALLDGVIDATKAVRNDIDLGVAELARGRLGDRELVKVRSQQEEQVGRAGLEHGKELEHEGAAGRQRAQRQDDLGKVQLMHDELLLVGR